MIEMIDDDLLMEASEFLGVGTRDLKKKYEETWEKYDGFIKWKNISENEWKARKIDQQNEKEVAAFYQETTNYILELIEYHSTPGRKRLTQIAIDIIKKFKGKDIVDFGAGIGQDSINQALAGLNATAVDLAGWTFEFAKWRFKKHKLNINYVDIIPGIKPLEDMYDAITCFEVMQHLVNPEVTLAHFYEHLNLNGVFLMTARFKGNYELALKENEHYEGQFCQIVENYGFILEDKIHMWGPYDERGKYLEIYRKFF